MRGTVTIGEKSIIMEANAASPYFYKQIFKEDFLAEVQKAEPSADLFQKMGYVMAMQGEDKKIADMLKLNDETFIKWLIQFDAMDVLIAADQISNLYFDQRKASSVPKNEGA